jgi:hypothetical protein
MAQGCSTDLLIKVVRLFIPTAVAAMVTCLCNAFSWQVYLCLKMQVRSSIYSLQSASLLGRDLSNRVVNLIPLKIEMRYSKFIEMSGV